MAKVEAIRKGYYNKLLREPGDRFECKFDPLPSWVKPLGGVVANAPAPSEPAGEPAPKPATKPAAKAVPTGEKSNGVADALGAAPDWVAPSGDL